MTQVHRHSEYILPNLYSSQINQERFNKSYNNYYIIDSDIKQHFKHLNNKLK